MVRLVAQGRLNSELSAERQPNLLALHLGEMQSAWTLRSPW